MTPTNTPREEALKQIEVAKLHAFEPTLEERQWILDRRSALSQPAPTDSSEWLEKAIKAIEPLQRECFADSHAGLNASLSVHSALEFLKAAYDQGRTQSAVPNGWKLVPIEPTAEMLEKGCDAFCNESLRNDPQGVKDQTYVPVYAAMLSAAPPVTGGAKVTDDLIALLTEKMKPETSLIISRMNSFWRTRYGTDLSSSFKDRETLLEAITDQMLEIDRAHTPPSSAEKEV